MGTVLKKDGKKFWKLSDQIIPDIPVRPEDIFITAQVNDRLDLLAQEHYGDVDMYRVIAAANDNLGKGSLFIPPGTIVRIPAITKEEYQELLEQYNKEK